MKVILVLFLVQFLVVLKQTDAASAKVCGPNEVYNQCGTACEETCAVKPEICILLCKEGCFCKTGYVRKTSNGPCILKSEC
ncbi:hypothetical protein ABEB36_000759 [Hypothenemus hampei]|uniref:TIL domain-containing protein n=1 Tax=Hypothenemus hampei TaxID=57062 RepID=A0ABD1FCC1_HYPHA